MLLNFRKFKIHSAILFQIGQIGSCHTYQEKLHLLNISCSILFQYNNLIFKAINFSQLCYLSALIKSSSLTHRNRISVSVFRPKKTGIVLPQLHQWNGTGSYLLSDHKTPLHTLKVNPKFTRLDHLTYYQSHPPLAGVFLGYNYAWFKGFPFLQSSTS